MTERDSTYYLEKRTRKTQEIREKHDQEHNEQRQREAYEKKKCPHCHKPIAEKLMQIATEAFLFDASKAEYNCQCERPSLREQTQLFLFTYSYGACSPVTIVGVQFPNDLIALSARFEMDDDTYQHTFKSLGAFKTMLNGQSVIHDWRIEEQP